MFGMGATLSVQDFLHVARSPQAVLLCLVVQAVIAPPLALGLSWLLQLPAGTSMGLLLIAALPGGLYSNVFTYLGRGNIALSVSATATASLGSLATTAFVLRTFGQTQLPDGFTMPLGRILTEIGIWLLLPLCLGMALHHAAPRRAPRVSKAFIWVSMVILAVFTVSALFSGRIDVTDYGWRTPVALVLFSIISFWICYALGFLIRLTVVDSFTVGIECVIRNVQLGILLAASLFPANAAKDDSIGSGAMFALLFYGGSGLVIAGFEIVARVKGFGFHAPKPGG